MTRQRYWGRWMIARTLAICLALTAVTPALAGNPAPPAMGGNPCDTASFPAHPPRSLRMARVRPGPHATFLTSHGACPNDTSACRQAAYVVQGDRLLTSVTRGPYTCAYSSNGRRESAGWLPTARLQTQPTPAAHRHDWLGTWRVGDSTLVIKQAGADLAVAANAYWPSGSDPGGHEGALNAKARPNASRLVLTDPDDPQGCRLTLILIGSSIVAHDNDACGGANVTLSGIYRK